MKELCIVIPTYNRADSIEYYLKTQLENFSNNDIDVWIYDSSDNELTKKSVECFQQKGYTNLFYKFYSSNDNIYGSWKTYYSLLECAKEYKYVWLSGDTTIIQINNIMTQVRNCLKEKYDIIHIYQSKDVSQSQAYSDCCEIFRLFWWSMTHWCSVVFSADILDSMSRIMEQYLKQNNGYFIVASVFEVMSIQPIRFYYIKDSLYTVSPFRVGSTDHLKRNILDSWAKLQSETIDSLSEIYDKYKDETKKSIDRNIYLFSFGGVIYLRADGNITMEKVREYKKYIKMVTKTPLLWFYLWALIPRGIAKFFVGIFSLINKMLQKAAVVYHKIIKK